MDFAKRHLEKYGWKEGKGLGKNEDGMSVALKPTLKFDNTGVGHEVGKDFTNKWWENVYDNAAKNIEVVKDEAEVKVKRIDDADEVEITTKDYSMRDFKKKNVSMEYGTFLKTAKLTQEGVINFDNVHAPVENSKCVVNQLSDEDLFAICGGRTAHKGARHGLKLSGKLSRIEKQEKMLLKKMQKIHLSEEPPGQTDCKKKLKKLRKLSETLIDQPASPEKAIASTSSGVGAANEARKKKKKRGKSVSFSETVLEYTVQEPEDNDSQGCSSSSSSVEKVGIQQRRLSVTTDEDPVTTDEGIELDCDLKGQDCGQNCFSEMQHSQKEKKKKKAKSQKAEREESSSPVEIVEVVVEAEKKKKKKRVRKDGQDVDIDGVGKIKKKKYQHKEIESISTSLEDLQISE